MGSSCSRRSPADDEDRSGDIDFKEFREKVTGAGSWSESEARRVFQAADRDCDGAVSPEEIAKSFRIDEAAWPGLQSLLDTGKWEREEVERFCSMADADSDGTVSAEECRRLHSFLDRDGDGRVGEDELEAVSDVAERRKFHASWLFDAADADGDGSITDAEARHLHGLSARDVMAFMQKADADSDGKISGEEMQDFVAKFDTDGDGKLSDAEWRKALGSPNPLARPALMLLRKHVLDRHLQPKDPLGRAVYRFAMAGIESKVAGGNLVSGIAREALNVGTEVAMAKALQAAKEHFAPEAQAVPRAPGAVAALPPPVAELGRERESRQCVLCRHADAAVKYKPCGHCLVCVRCYGQQLSRCVLRCPQCGEAIEP